jgi:hypothetical protein
MSWVEKQFFFLTGKSSFIQLFCLKQNVSKVKKRFFWVVSDKFLTGMKINLFLATFFFSGFTRYEKHKSQKLSNKPNGRESCERKSTNLAATKLAFSTNIYFEQNETILQTAFLF